MFNKLKKKAEEAAKKVKETAEDTASKVNEKIPDELKDLKNKAVDATSQVAEKTNEIATSAKTIANDNLENFSDTYLDSHLDEIESYCSWCFEKTTCTLKEKNNLSRNIYTCNNCGKEVVKCRVCNNKAKYSLTTKNKDDEIDMWSNNFCAVHEGKIAKFETLKWSLKSIGEYRDIVERTEKNYKKIGTTAAFTLGGAAVIAPLALAAAPAVGGALGTSLLGYSGAAATNSGLALLGGGALAAGGAGMAGGVAVVTAAGSALGGKYGAVIANSYFGDIDDFDIIKIKPGKDPTVICIDGFLTQGDSETADTWIKSLSKHYPENTIYHLRWESKRLRDLANTFAILPGGKEAARKQILNAALSASKAAAKKVAPLAIAFQTLGLANNPWSVASTKAYETGALLADIIARTDQEYILIGHSLGARVIYACLASLKTKDKCFVKNVHLLGGAVNNNCISDEDGTTGVNWYGIDQAVSGAIYNYYSKNDSVLQILYKVGEGVKFDLGDPIGRHAIPNDKIQNIDVSTNISGHTKYKQNLETILIQEEV